METTPVTCLVQDVQSFNQRQTTATIRYESLSVLPRDPNSGLACLQLAFLLAPVDRCAKIDTKDIHKRLKGKYNEI